MTTIKATCDDGIHTKVYIDGKPVTYPVTLSLDVNHENVPSLLLEELATEHGAVRKTTEWALGSFTLVAEPPD